MTDLSKLPVHVILRPEDIEGDEAALRKIYINLSPEADIAVELWPTLSYAAKKDVMDSAQCGDVAAAAEDLLLEAVENGTVVPQWVIDAGDQLLEHWGWSPNVETACAALQARLDEHNRGGGE